MATFQVTNAAEPHFSQTSALSLDWLRSGMVPLGRIRVAKIAKSITPARQAHLAPHPSVRTPGRQPCIQ